MNMNTDFASMRHIALVSLVDDDYDQAKAFYRDRLGFECLTGQAMPEEKRWLVRQAGKSRCASGLLLAKADGGAQAVAIGNQTSGRVGFFLHTNDFDADFLRMKDNDSRFLEELRHPVYGHGCHF